MSETAACVRGEVETNWSYEAPLFPFDALGQRGRSAVAVSRTSGVSEEPEDTLNGHGRARGDLPLVRPRIPIRPQGRFEVLQQYEGVVLSIGHETFWARLIDRTRPGAPDVEAEFPLDEVSPTDRSLLAEGAVFYWYIGYHDSASGQRTRQSLIRLRRLPAVTKEDLDAAREEANRLLSAWGREGGNERVGHE